MNADLIKMQLHEQVCNSSKWDEILQNTTPGNDGPLDTNVDLDKLYVNPHERTFKFFKTKFWGKVQFGGSGKDGYPLPFSEKFSGHGTFEFDGKDNVKIIDIEFDNKSLNLFS